jgi:hypothetical protein
MCLNLFLTYLLVPNETRKPPNGEFFKKEHEDYIKILQGTK